MHRHEQAAPGGPRDPDAALPDVEQQPDVSPPPPDAIADLLAVQVDPGHTVLCVSDLHLRPAISDASAWASTELARALGSIEGPATLIMIGDVLEMWFVQPPDAAGPLAAHDELVAAIGRFASSPGRRVIYTLGNHDARLAWDGELYGVVKERLGCEFAFAVELLGGDGSTGRVRVEHGHAYDPANAFHDPRDPRESPLGMHIVEEILPELHFTEKGPLQGMDSLSNPRTFPGFMSSRYFYRRVLGIAGWIIVPAMILYLTQIVLSLILIGMGDVRYGFDDVIGARLLGFNTAHIAVFALIVLVAVVVARRKWREGAGAVAERRGATQNTNTREAAERFVERGYAGMVAAHTHRCELTPLGESAFYANTGSCTKVVDRAKAKFDLPSVYLPRLQLSWVTLHHSERWTVELTAARRTAEGSSRLERLVARRDQRNLAGDPTVAARFPGGPFLHE